MSKLSKTISIRFAELLEAFEFANGGFDECRAWLCRATGKIYLVTGQEDLDQEVPEDIEELDDLVKLPTRHDLDLGTRLVLAFVRQKMPDEYDQVRAIFRKKGAYGRWKDLLHSERMLRQWYEYEVKATEEALREWCRNNDIEVTDA